MNPATNVGLGVPSPAMFASVQGMERRRRLVAVGATVAGLVTVVLLVAGKAAMQSWYSSSALVDEDGVAETKRSVPREHVRLACSSGARHART